MLSDNIAQSSQGFILLSEISQKDKAWDKHKSNSLVISNKYDLLDYIRYAERIRECANYLEFCYQTAKNNQELELRLFDASFCRVRLCPICSWRRSMRWVVRFRRGLPLLFKDYPDISFLLLTLTIKNCTLSDLRDNITFLNKSWKRLTQRKVFPAIGYLKALEVTKGVDNSAHPHIHAVLVVRKSYFSKGYLSHETWRNLWRDCSRLDYQPIVNVKRIKPSKNYADPCDALLESLREVLKYSVKPSDLLESSSEWLGELTKQLHNTRAVSVSGILKNYISDKEPDDLIGISKDDKLEHRTGDLLFGFKEHLHSYVMIDK